MILQDRDEAKECSVSSTHFSQDDSLYICNLSGFQRLMTAKISNLPFDFERLSTILLESHLNLPSGPDNKIQFVTRNVRLCVQFLDNADQSPKLLRREPCSAPSVAKPSAVGHEALLPRSADDEFGIFSDAQGP
jgi:hypothetical protein